MTEHVHDAHDDPKQQGHAPAAPDFGAAFAIGIALNVGFVVVEIVYGLLAQSVALVADAGHNLGDVLGLVMAWVASVLARRIPSVTHTYGLRRGTILAALANAMLLLVAVGAIAVEGVHRLIEPAPVAGVTVMVVAAIGIAVNGVTAWLFASGRKGDINLRKLSESAVGISVDETTTDDDLTDLLKQACFIRGPDQGLIAAAKGALNNNLPKMILTSMLLFDDALRPCRMHKSSNGFARSTPLFLRTLMSEHADVGALPKLVRWDGAEFNDG